MLPGKDGMIHISKLANHRVEKVEDVVKIGDDTGSEGRRKSTRRVV